MNHTPYIHLYSTYTPSVRFLYSFVYNSPPHSNPQQRPVAAQRRLLPFIHVAHRLSAVAGHCPHFTWENHGDNRTKKQ